MNSLKKFTKAIGFGVCWPLPAEPDNYELKLQTLSKVPIFWLMGPDGAGKNEFAVVLAYATKFTIINVQNLLKQEVARGKMRGEEIKYYLQKGQCAPMEAVVSLIRDYIHYSFDDDIGFIVVGFPDNLREAKWFEMVMGKVYIVIYCWLNVDTLMDRIWKKYEYNKIDVLKVRKKYLLQQRNCEEIFRWYENKAMKVHMTLPLEESCQTLICNLNSFFGYKFDLM